nr:WXG100 family type VII secretion target [Schaalia vaccimaxillae]
MAMYAVDSHQVSLSAARVAATADRIRSEVGAMLAELMALQETWTGVAHANFSGTVSQWQATQAQVEASLTSISSQMHMAANVYAEAEAQSSALFSG